MTAHPMPEDVQAVRFTGGVVLRRQVRDAILARGSATPEDLAAALRTPLAQVNGALEMLWSAGLVEPDPEGHNSFRATKECP